MPTRSAEATWDGQLRNGEGHLKLGSGAFEGPFSFETRFENGSGANPEELLGAAHAGCYSMALSKLLGEAGHTPEHIDTLANVHLDQTGDGFAISRISLATEARVPGVDEDEFRRIANDAKNQCLVSQIIQGPEIELEAQLRS